jgi:valyl-tRNA synthetase
MSTELPKQYDPAQAQERWLQFWDEHGYFHSRPDFARQPFTIVIPPPNVTGALHMGHALNNTLQDVLVRWRRMQGYNTLWMPGTDHAGIATQAVVERLIYAKEKKTRRDLGRDELVRRIWAWKDTYEKRILDQLRRLGCSCDWARTRFTMDEGLSRAVRLTFFNWFRDGLIFRGKRLVNWDTHLQTSVADDETYTEDTKGGFWTFRYPVKGEPGVSATGGTEVVRFSTTRPETMLGDTAVAVHPNDERYRHLIGQTVVIPLNGREIPIIADGLLVDPSLGTGCVKVTPAHDFNDYACGLRHKLPMMNILNPDGTINENGGRFQGMDRYPAREAVTAEMERLGYFEGREDRDIPLKFSDRSKTPIEPYLSDQWFVKMGDAANGSPGLAQTAMDAVTAARVQFAPERYAKSYLDWLGEKRDWCISRQLWWGHRIPVWYATCPEAELKRAFADREDVCWRLDEENGRWLVCALTDLPADALGPKYGLQQDPDVLDTWFSSQLWPYSTLGWPERTTELAYYYPTSVLVTSRDIITLWVARMVLSALYNTNNIPFRQVYITPKLLDAFGVTMSKSKGNGVDPLDIIDHYGADALRFQMVFLTTDNQDSRLAVSNVCPHCGAFVPVRKENMDPDLAKRPRKLTCPSCKKPFRPGGPWPDEDPKLPTARQASKDFEMGRNFANKIWNAARFLLLNLEGYTPGAVRVEELPLEDRWILSQLAATTAEVTQHLENYHFSDVARTIYEFTWSEFCDWYVEMSKGRLRDPGDRPVVQRVLVGVLDAILRLVHPVMPFVAESLWQALGEAAFERGLPAPEPAAESVTIAPWPDFPAAWKDSAMEQRIGRMQELVRAVRNIRNQFMVDEKATVEVWIHCKEAVASDFALLQGFIGSLAKVNHFEAGPEIGKPPGSVTWIHPEFELYVGLRTAVDIKGVMLHLEKQLAEKRKYLSGAQAKLENANFVERAPPEVVQQQRDLVVDLQSQIEVIERNLRELRAA